MTGVGERSWCAAPRWGSEGGRKMKSFRLAALTAALVAPLGARVQTKGFSLAAAALAVLLAVAGLVVGPTSSASALTSGPQSFTGFLIVTGVSGERVELA